MGGDEWSLALNVTALDFYVTPAPNPPMAKDNNVSITPTTRNFGVNGGGNAILVSGNSATWTAAVSDPWITLNATSGNVGYPVAYTVSANTNVEQRTGYVYVSGWVHTVTQDGVGGTISPENVTYEHQGGSGTIVVSAANKMVWQARPNVDWLSVTPTSGAGEGSVTYQVAPYNEVATRQGTLTVAGNTFTVFQYGRRMKLSTYAETRDYETHVIPITVNALAITQWSVTPNNSWISVVDAGNGQGGDLVTIAIAENPSYRARTGTVTIGTETFTVTQQGRPTAALSFSVSPTASTASVEGANGMISVTATPDLPWTATSGANWITIYTATVNGSGNGNVVYSASPNPTLAQRTGTVTITPEATSGVAAKTHTVTYSPGANGSGSQQTATKTHGVALTLKGATFTRSGYTQTGWSTSDGGAKTYDLGASYTTDAAVTLYPFWTADDPGGEELGGVQLWEGGPYWAECNVGAAKPEEYGYYFWWGDTVGYTNTGSGWISVKDGTSISFTDSGTAASTWDKDHSALQSEGWIDSTGNLVAAHDAATAHLGAPWRMPTDAEFSALIENCTTTWITTNGVRGRLVTGKGNYADRSVFLPACGYGNYSVLSYPGSDGNYWSSTPYSDYFDYAWYLDFDSRYIYRYYYSSRHFGQSVRPVRGFAE